MQAGGSGGAQPPSQISFPKLSSEVTLHMCMRRHVNASGGSGGAQTPQPDFISKPQIRSEFEYVYAEACECKRGVWGGAAPPARCVFQNLNSNMCFHLEIMSSLGMSRGCLFACLPAAWLAVSWFAELLKCIFRLLTYLLAYSPTYLLSHLPACSHLLTYCLAWSLTCLLTYLLACLLAYLLTYVLAYLLTCLLTCFLTYLLTCLLTC